MTLLVIAAVAVLLVGAVAVLLRRAQRPDEAARFQHASDLTRTWAQVDSAPVPVPRPTDPGRPEDASGPAGSDRD